MKISFDFDSTLSKTHIQEFADQLIKDGHDVWIVTSRASDEDQPYWLINGMKSKRGNDDLFEVSDKLKIPRNQIVFINHELKSEFFKDKDFLVHLDDDWIEINHINKETKTKAISCFGNTNWRNEMLRIINNENK